MNGVKILSFDASARAASLCISIALGANDGALGRGVQLEKPKHTPSLTCSLILGCMCAHTLLICKKKNFFYCKILSFTHFVKNKYLHVFTSRKFVELNDAWCVCVLMLLLCSFDSLVWCILKSLKAKKKKGKKNKKNYCRVHTLYAFYLFSFCNSCNKFKLQIHKNSHVKSDFITAIMISNMNIGYIYFVVVVTVAHCVVAGGVR